MPDLAQRIEQLKSLTLTRHIGPEALQYLARQAQPRSFQANEIIYHQGDPGTTCHILLRGKVRVYVSTIDGQELSVNILGRGEIVGEMALFEDLPRSATVEAMGPTQTLELYRETLIASLKQYPDLALALLRALSSRLRHATKEAEGLASLTVVERLQRQLQQLADLTGHPVSDGTRITVPLTQQELATLVGTSRESVNRALAQLRRKKKIRLDRGWIVLLGSDGGA